MAKTTTGLKGTLGLQKVAIKPTEIDIDRTEKAVKDLHAEKSKLTRVSIDMPKDLFKSMKVKVVQEDKTVRDYVLALIAKDLNI
jgi:hypothetical protein